MQISQKQLEGILSIAILLISVLASGQSTLKREMPVDDLYVKLEYRKKADSRTADPSKVYAYMRGNKIIHSQGAYDGYLLHGAYTEYNSNKELLKKGIYKNGLMDGAWFFWNTNGTLDSMVTFKNGLRHGISVKYVNGEAKEKLLFKKGQEKERKKKSKKIKLPRKGKSDQPEEVVFEEKQPQEVQEKK